MKEYSGFILSYNGGEIIEWGTGRLLYKNLLPDDVLPILYTASVRNEQAILTYDPKAPTTNMSARKPF